MVDTYLYEIELPPLRLRIRGMKGQLEILQAAFVHAQDLAFQLYHLSAALDRQETIISENVEKLAALDEQLQIVSLRLQQRFTAPHHQTISALIQCFSDFSAFCRNAEQVQSEVSFGTLLKRQQLQTLYTLKQIYDTLSNT